MDHGCLWKVNETVLTIFKTTEYYFKQAISKYVDCESIMSNLLSNSIILNYFKILKNKSNETIKKEIAVNLMEHLLTQISL